MINVPKKGGQYACFFLSMIENPDDSKKYEQIYIHHRDQMMRIAMKILKNNQYDAEDAVHNAFLTLVNHIKDLPDHDSEYTKRYVYKMARNSALDIYRKHYGEKETVSLDDLFDIPDDTDIPQEYENNETYQHYLYILGKMPPRYRDILSLYFLDGKKPAQIASLLQLPIQTVKKQLHRGKKIFLGNISKEEYHYDRSENAVSEASIEDDGEKRTSRV